VNKEIKKGDICLIKGKLGTDVCVQVLGKLQSSCDQVEVKYVGQKYIFQSKTTTKLRRIFLQSEILKKL